MIDFDLNLWLGMRVSVGYLHDSGFIHTADKDNSKGQVDILVPYSVLVALICSSSAYKPIQSSLVTSISNLKWLELEELELHFLKLFFSAFNAVGSSLSIKFSDIWRGAIAQQYILRMKIKIPKNNSFCCGEEEGQWIAEDFTMSKPLPFVQLKSNIQINLQDKNGVFLAGQGNPLFDVRSKLEIDTTTVPVEEDFANDPIPTDNNPSKYLEASQVKIRKH